MTNPVKIYCEGVLSDFPGTDAALVATNVLMLLTGTDLNDWRARAEKAEAERDALRALLREAGEALKSCSEDLAAELNNRFEIVNGGVHPAMVRQFERDTEPVRRAASLADRIKKEIGE